MSTTVDVILSREDLLDIGEALRHRAQHAHIQADTILDGTSPVTPADSDARYKLAMARRNHGRRLEQLASKIETARREGRWG